jgi:hypothetical protein
VTHFFVRALLRVRSAIWFVGAALLFLFLLGACEACRGNPNGPQLAAKTDGDTRERPTARLYLISDLAGALEPCGCVKDQLGGMDHLAALVGSEKAKGVKDAAVLSAGPLFFMDMELPPDRRAQEAAKAETIASSLKHLGLAAFAPGRNDWANGEAALAKLRDESGAPMLAANVTGAAAASPGKHVVKDIGGLKIGIVGVAAPDKAKTPIDGVASSPAIEAAKEQAAAAKKEGAQVVVVLAAVGRGEAKRIADGVPDLLAVVVGSTGGGGEANTKAPPAERVGDVLVVETANHLQTVAVLDLYVRGRAAGEIKLADGTGIDRIRKREELQSRVDELRARLATWETDKSVDKKDIEARRADLAKLEAERDALDKGAPPASGSFFRYAMRDVREGYGSDDTVKSQMLAYYKRVNEHNKAELASKKPAPAPPGQAYVGVETCTNCHEEPRAVWDKTKHATAYATLEKQFKEFNLDCVSCHVTGYDRPGGSTVTHVAELKNVQCEVCHGPGQSHAKANGKVKVPVPKPEPETCLACHHPPHVHTFDAKAKMAEILGPGHGRPKE